MNGKNGCIQINISSGAKTKNPEDSVEFSCKGWISKVWKFVKEDSNRVKFSFKVGLAAVLVSLLILIRAPYEVFSTNIIWSILTVAIMFEYTVGATFNRGFNCALGSLLAGILAIAVAQFALSIGRVSEPIIIGFSIFFVGFITSFIKLLPSLAQHEYGFRVTLFTYCLIIVSGYQMGNPVRTAMDRLYLIAIGAFVAVLVNVLVFPIWAGDQFAQGTECVKKYLEDEGLDYPEFTKMLMDEFPDEPAYKKCKSTLNSSAKMESSPPHGKFGHLFYPWSEYVKVGAVLQYCAYEVMALHGVLHSEIQVPHSLRIMFKPEIQDVTNQAAELLRSMGKDISNMKTSLKSSSLKRVHSSTARLQRAVDIHSYLPTNSYSTTDTPPSNLSKPAIPKILSHDLDSKNTITKENPNTGTENTFTATVETPDKAAAESYHDTMRKQTRSRRLHSWPSREVDAFKDDLGGFSPEFLPRMSAVEGTVVCGIATCHFYFFAY